MPSLGAPELVIIFLVILVPIAVGYWCMTVYRKKGYSPGAGFAIGFLLTLFVSVIGAAVALLIVYLSRPVSAGFVGGPLPPQPDVADDARLVATFGPSTGWNGKRVLFDGRTMLVEGEGQVSAKKLLSYAKQGQIVWASDTMQNWVTDKAKYS